jgi:hypothetical protein
MARYPLDSGTMTRGLVFARFIREDVWKFQALGWGRASLTEVKTEEWRWKISKQRKGGADAKRLVSFPLLLL